ncbi:MAG TPA: (2Fe-2S) ferredoxin domain-containing protein [Terriglobales bacterium]|nr:(2Fe-2S) ferredoxin domain-containing protein [Terriglobales bacterium]
MTEVLVCMNIDCRNRGAEGVKSALEEKLDASGVSATVKEYICFSACNSGPNLVIPDKRCWFSGVTPNDVDAVVNFLNGGPDIPKLKEKNEPDLEEMIFGIIDAGLT